MYQLTILLPIKTVRTETSNTHQDHKRRQKSRFLRATKSNFLRMKTLFLILPIQSNFPSTIKEGSGWQPWQVTHTTESAIPFPTDKLIILEDTNNDGKADKQTNLQMTYTFRLASKLHMTGFMFLRAEALSFFRIKMATTNMTKEKFFSPALMIMTRTMQYHLSVPTFRSYYHVRRSIFTQSC